MATPRPFGAPTTFTPRFTPQGLLQRSISQTNADAAAAAARIRSSGGAARTTGFNLGSVGNMLRSLGGASAGNVLGKANLLLQIPAVYAQARQVLNPKDNIVTSFQNLGTSIQNLNVPLAKQRHYVGSDPFAVRMNRAIEAAAASQPPRSGGSSFIGPTQQTYEVPGVGIFEQRTGRFLGRGSSQQATGTPSGTPAAERAYRQEVSSVAQQAAQNPELQRYEKERAAAAASKDQGKMDAVRDLGMQIWAQKYGKPGDLASRVKPGQSGYDVIQRTLGAGQMGSPMNFGFDASSPLATTPPVAAPSYAGATPASLPGATPLPSNAFSGMVTTPYDRFNAGQTLTSAPLGMPGAQIPGTYEGATGVQGMGASLGATPSMFNPSDEKAKALLEAFKNRQFSVQK